MAELVTADELARIATELQSMSRTMRDFVYWFGNDVGHTREATDNIFSNWFGPRADAALDVIANYLDGLDEVVPAVESQIAIVDAMAKFAEELEPALREAEAQWATYDHWLTTPVRDEDTEIISAVDFNAMLRENRALANAARDEIIEISARWVYARNQWCDWSLPSGNSALQGCCEAMVQPVAGMPYVRGDAYLARVSEFAATFDIPLAAVDSSARDKANDYWAALTADDSLDGLIISVAFDTADDDGIENRDQDVSSGDAEAMTDPEVARIQVRDAADALGVELSDDELDRLTALAVSSAWIASAAWNADGADVEDSLEDRLEAQHDIENPADDGGELGPPPRPDEIDWSTIPANPFDVDHVDFDGIGLCSSASGNLGPIAGEYASCIVSTDEALAGTNTYAVGVSADGLTGGGASGSLGFGVVQTNAQDVDQLGGYAITFALSGGAGAGAAGAVSYSLEEGPDGVWRFNGFVSMQGSVTVTSGDADASSSITRTDVVWENGMLNVVRRPVEGTVDEVEDFFRLPLDIDRAFRFAR